jgi:Asp-tRNA(Asn)/Glu-tRNA(Gln) amidotransferase A subunit family amidase
MRAPCSGAVETGCYAPRILLYIVRVATFTSIAAFAAQFGADANASPRDAEARVSDAIAKIRERAAADNASQRIYTQILGSRACRAAESRRADRTPPLLGVPVAIKDNIDVQGAETSCGRRLACAPAMASAALAERLESLGAIIIGKTNLDEAALGASGRNPRFGRCSNPRFPDRLSGGSSSGSAAAVAAGHALLGVGTDTLGSVRIPAAFCGVVGFKPSHGRLSMAGVAPLYPDFDSVGLLALSLSDIENVAGLLLEENAPPGHSQSAVHDAGLDPARRIAVLDDAALADVQAEVATGYRQCVSLLEESGWMQGCAAPQLDWAAMARAAFWEVAHEFAERSAGASPRHRASGHGASGYGAPGYRPLHDIDGELGRVLAKAASRPASKLADGRILIEQSASRLKHCLQEAEAVLTPTCPQSAPSVHEDPVSHIAAFTAPANAAGLPAVAWSQRLASGPLSLQLIGRYGDDLRLLGLASRVQRHLELISRTYTAGSH